ncbi:hypothetical protein Pst134EB_022066 [Puccinia striiformis f. sp. tritici]|nr:hypothetical protein Pst134EB_022066 [Puccinia striiformis f. sp. tritici]
MTHSTNPEEPPYWMLPTFKPRLASRRDLLGALSENYIPHSFTKKEDLAGYEPSYRSQLPTQLLLTWPPYPLASLVEREVMPKVPELLEAHRNVKPSCVGIFDMQKGRYLTDKDWPAVTSTGTTSGPQTPLSSAINSAVGGQDAETLTCPFTKHVSPMKKVGLRGIIEKLDPTLKIPSRATWPELMHMAVNKLRTAAAVTDQVPAVFLENWTSGISRADTDEAIETFPCPFKQRVWPMTLPDLRTMIYTLDPRSILPTNMDRDELRIIAIEKLKSDAATNPTSSKQTRRATSFFSTAEGASPKTGVPLSKNAPHDSNSPRRPLSRPTATVPKQRAVSGPGSFIQPGTVSSPVATNIGPIKRGKASSPLGPIKRTAAPPSQLSSDSDLTPNPDDSSTEEATNSAPPTPKKNKGKVLQSVSSGDSEGNVIRKLANEPLVSESDDEGDPAPNPPKKSVLSVQQPQPSNTEIPSRRQKPHLPRHPAERQKAPALQNTFFGQVIQKRANEPLASGSCGGVDVRVEQAAPVVRDKGWKPGMPLIFTDTQSSPIGSDPSAPEMQPSIHEIFLSGKKFRQILPPDTSVLLRTTTPPPDVIVERIAGPPVLERTDAECPLHSKNLQSAPPSGEKSKLDLLGPVSLAIIPELELPLADLCLQISDDKTLEAQVCSTEAEESPAQDNSFTLLIEDLTSLDSATGWNRGYDYTNIPLLDQPPVVDFHQPTSNLTSQATQDQELPIDLIDLTSDLTRSLLDDPINDLIHEESDKPTLNVLIGNDDIGTNLSVPQSWTMTSLSSLVWPSADSHALQPNISSGSMTEDASTSTITQPNTFSGFSADDASTSIIAQQIDDLNNVGHFSTASVVQTVQLDSTTQEATHAGSADLPALELITLSGFPTDDPSTSIVAQHIDNLNNVGRFSTASVVQTVQMDSTAKEATHAGLSAISADLPALELITLSGFTTNDTSTSIVAQQIDNLNNVGRFSPASVVQTVKLDSTTQEATPADFFAISAGSPAPEVITPSGFTTDDTSTSIVPQHIDDLINVGRFSPASVVQTVQLDLTAEEAIRADLSTISANSSALKRITLTGSTTDDTSTSIVAQQIDNLNDVDRFSTASVAQTVQLNSMAEEATPADLSTISADSPALELITPSSFTTDNASISIDDLNNVVGHFSTVSIVQTYQLDSRTEEATPLDYSTISAHSPALELIALSGFTEDNATTSPTAAQHIHNVNKSPSDAIPDGAPSDTRPAGSSLDTLVPKYRFQIHGRCLPNGKYNPLK